MEVTDNNPNHNSMSKEEKALNQKYSRAGTKSYHAQQAMGKQDTKMVDKMFEIENLLDDLKAAEGVDHTIVAGKLAQARKELDTETVELSRLKREFDQADR